MKRTISIIISMMCVATALLFSACNSNSNSSNENTAAEWSLMNDPIVGTWQVNSYSCKIYLDGAVVDEYYVNNPAGEIVFNNDGSFTRYGAQGESYSNEWVLLDDGICYSLGYDTHILSNLISQMVGEDWIECAPATYLAKLIDNQTLEVQESVYATVAKNEGEGEGKCEIEMTGLYERIQ